jgi:hypothetical protein
MPANEMKLIRENLELLEIDRKFLFSFVKRRIFCGEKKVMRFFQMAMVPGTKN